MDRSTPPTDPAAAPAPAEPAPIQRVIDMWLSDDPPWDPEVLENVEELSGRLEDLRTRFGTL